MEKKSFGQELKSLRKQAKIPSKVLSQKVGKAVTYVSQLERELIKNPSYSTCLRILIELGLKEEEAEKLLYYYNIHSKEEIQANSDIAIKMDEEYKWKINSGYYEKKFEKIEKNKNLFLQLSDRQFDLLGLHDNSRADHILQSLINLLSSEEKADSFFSLFENDFSKLNIEEIQALVRRIDKDYKKLMTDKFLNREEEI